MPKGNNETMERNPKGYESINHQTRHGGYDGTGADMSKANYTYLYNGIIVRKSNRVYNFGLINHDGAIIACSSTEQGALKEKKFWLNHYKRNIEYCEKKGKLERAELIKVDLENVKKWHIVTLERITNKK